jgi:uncharacterized protein (DUF2267 family)/pterin-4a-carbinolamine dehydratase
VTERANEPAPDAIGGRLQYEELLADIAARLGVDPPGRAALVTRAVLADFSAQLRPPSRERLAAVLPPLLAVLVTDTVRSEPPDADRFVQEVASGTVGTTPEHALYYVQAVLSALDAAAPDVTRDLRAELPPEFDGLFTAPGEGPPPEVAASAAEPVPTELTDEEVAAALRRLPGWSGDRHALTRTVVLPPGLDHPMLNRVHQIERDMQHRAVIERSASDNQSGGRELTFRVWTHSVGVVTELDVELARRISDAIESF